MFFTPYYLLITWSKCFPAQLFPSALDASQNTTWSASWARQQGGEAGSQLQLPPEGLLEELPELSVMSVSYQRGCHPAQAAQPRIKVRSGLCTFLLSEHTVTVHKNQQLCLRSCAGVQCWINSVPLMCHNLGGGKKKTREKVCVFVH